LDSADPGWDKSIQYFQADACALPQVVWRHKFDLVYSNSVIEHVGGHWRRRAFADAVGALAPHYWVQTPARSFPIEPHWLFPGFQFLPIRVRASISRHWSMAAPGFRNRSPAEAIEDVLSVELVSAAEMQLLFPQSTLYHERLLGFTKSLVAVR
jgi:hypothetical protein